MSVPSSTKLLKIVPDCNDLNKHKNGYTPHLSVGQIKGKEKLIQVLDKLQKTWKELRFVLNSIFLYPDIIISNLNLRLSKKYR